MPAVAAIALNGALFGAMHGTDFLPTGICGAFFCWGYHRYGRLSVPVLMHVFANLSATAIWLYSYSPG
jgi:membrane protease YdiL (CAAX protease family)